jgi:hypothetical protein
MSISNPLILGGWTDADYYSALYSAISTATSGLMNPSVGDQFTVYDTLFTVGTISSPYIYLQDIDGNTTTILASGTFSPFSLWSLPKKATYNYRFRTRPF